MAFLVVSKPDLPIWIVVVVWIYIAFMFWNVARGEQRRRLEEGSTRTLQDTLLLLFAGVAVVGTILYGEMTHSRFIGSRIGIAVVIIGVGGGLIVLFNQKRL